MSVAEVDGGVRQHVAAEVRAALARKRISVREAARRLEMEQTSLHRRVTGKIPFDAEVLAKLSDLLDVPIEQFFIGRPHTGVNIGRYGLVGALHLGKRHVASFA